LDDFSGNSNTVGPGDHPAGSGGGPRAVKLVPRVSSVASWADALVAQHGADAAGHYIHDDCSVLCCDEAEDDYLDGLHRVRELAMLGLDDQAAALAGALCTNGSTALAPLATCEAFDAVHGEACMMVAMRESSGDIFGAMPMWRYNSYDGELLAAFDKMEWLEDNIRTFSSSDQQLNDLRATLQDSKAGVRDQLVVYDNNLKVAEVELRAVGETVRLMGDLVLEQRAALASMARPTLNGTRLELERLRWELDATSYATQTKFLGFLGDAAGSALNGVKEGGRIAIALGGKARDFAVDEVFIPVGAILYSAACNFFEECLPQTIAQKLLKSPAVAWTPLVEAIGGAGVTDSWRALTRQTSPGSVVGKVQADGGVHRVRRAAVMAKAVYMKYRPRTLEGLRDELHSNLYLDEPPTPGIPEINLAHLHFADNAATGCPSAIAAFSPGDECDPAGPSLYFAFQGTDFGKSCSKYINSNFIERNVEVVDGVKLNPGYARYVLGKYGNRGEEGRWDGTQYKSPWSFVLEVLAKYSSTKLRHITLSGHSLGGALAVATGVRLRQHLRENSDVAHAFYVVSLAAPRTIAEISLRGLASFPHTRVTYGNDLVALVPAMFYHETASLHFESQTDGVARVREQNKPDFISLDCDTGVDVADFIGGILGRVCGGVLTITGGILDAI